MNFNYLIIILLSCLSVACSNNHPAESPSSEETAFMFQDTGQQLVNNMVQKVGDYRALLEKKDVIYTYTYQTPDGKTDQTTEKYIFDGELSYGAYHQHDRTFPQLEGLIEQGYDGEEYWLKHNGEVLNDQDMLKRVAFNRPTNFYWFTMMQKLLDPGLNYEYLGEKNIEGKDYDIVKVTFSSNDDKPTDIYQIYINKETSLVDQFLFTVADFGKMEIPNLMTLKYEEIDGFMIPTERLYKKSTWDADVSEEPWIKVNWSDITFNNNLTKEDFKKS